MISYKLKNKMQLILRIISSKYNQDHNKPFNMSQKNREVFDSFKEEDLIFRNSTIRDTALSPAQKDQEFFKNFESIKSHV